ncbi:hypothetical protein [Amycolatopsis sp. SID8362]|uniref:hypothetical protein n=1 Tax=Amycolatopsis sp. SID8362 TaxID=2690346 RepID=UPI0013D64DEC|nr:hypothetical protein [Amycolatopsis sp. SID8362]NED39291.1 hypothetical protein [Amycolatopsis sp. SID8362]
MQQRRDLEERRRIVHQEPHRKVAERLAGRARVTVELALGFAIPRESAGRTPAGRARQQFSPQDTSNAPITLRKCACAAGNLRGTPNQPKRLVGRELVPHSLSQVRRFPHTISGRRTRDRLELFEQFGRVLRDCAEQPVPFPSRFLPTQRA